MSPGVTVNTKLGRLVVFTVDNIVAIRSTDGKNVANVPLDGTVEDTPMVATLQDGEPTSSSPPRPATSPASASTATAR